MPVPANVAGNQSKTSGCRAIAADAWAKLIVKQRQLEHCFRVWSSNKTYGERDRRATQRPGSSPGPGGRLIASLMGLLIVLVSNGFAARANGSPVDLVALRADETLVMSVGYRLTAFAGDLCPQKAASIGVEVDDLGSYAPAYRAQAERDLGLGELPAVSAVAAGGPAARAGVRSGDAITAVDGVAVPAQNGFAREQQVLAALDLAASKGDVHLALVRAQHRLDIVVRPELTCPTRFQVKPSSELQALADGHYVEITTGLVHFVRGPDQLAAVLAHELAHNILHHRERLDAAGRTPDRILQTENEADRLSIYLVDRAGYSVQAARDFWARLAHHSARARGMRTHLPSKQRLGEISAEIARMQALKAAGKQSEPAFMENGTLPPLR